MLVGRRLVLRTVREPDLALLYDAAADVRDMGQPWPLHLVSERMWKKRYDENGMWSEDAGVLPIANQAGTLIGQISFFKAQAYLTGVEIGYRLYKPEYRRQGLMSEAVSMFCAFMFQSRPAVERIQAATLLDNLASQRVLVKCGFQFEGVLRRATFHWGEYHDIRMYSLLRDECAPLWAQLAV